EKPMIEFSGVLSSWLTTRRNARFWASSVPRRAFGDGSESAGDLTADNRDDGSVTALQSPHWTRQHGARPLTIPFPGPQESPPRSPRVWIASGLSRLAARPRSA